VLIYQSVGGDAAMLTN